MPCKFEWTTSQNLKFSSTVGQQVPYVKVPYFIGTIPQAILKATILIGAILKATILKGVIPIGTIFKGVILIATILT